MKYILFGILIYIGLVFIFRIVIPVFIASRKIKKGFREMQGRMEEQMCQQQQQQGYTPQEPGPQKPKEKAGDYIDFEEVK